MPADGQHDDATTWDTFYARDDATQIWSGRPNGTLVTEVADLPPGRALDVGCGEGSDAIWLAEHGWQVTAVDPSGVALDRAAATARRRGADVTWVRAGLLSMPNGTGQHDLVTAHYPVLCRTEVDAAIVALLEAVAPGGTLLFVHHEMTRSAGTHADGEHDVGAGHGPDDLVMPADVVAHLDERWQVEVHEPRLRPAPPTPDRAHVRDLVLRARRRPPTIGASIP